MELTRKQTIANHRKMWRWIKEETLKRKECVSKSDYFKENGIDDIPLAHCYCCEYIRGRNNCEHCPIQWNGLTCRDKSTFNDWEGIWSLWDDAVCQNNYLNAAELSGTIAELPERYEKDV